MGVLVGLLAVDVLSCVDGGGAACCDSDAVMLLSRITPNLGRSANE